MNSSVVAVDLFCGCGGLTCGMREAGIEVLAGFDIDPRLRDLYELNNPGSRFVLKDIKDVTASEVKAIFSERTGPKVLAGCAPCRPFSTINGGRKGNKHMDYGLLDYFTKLISEIKPDAVIMENVPGLTRSGKRVFKRFRKALCAVGLMETYDASLDSANYGVAQHRKRLILIAAKSKPKLPSKSHGPGTKHRYRTVRDVISYLEPIEAGHREYNVRNHSTKNLSDLNLLRIQKTPTNGGSRRDLPKDLWIPSHKKHEGHNDTYGRMEWDKPAPTLTCRCISVSNGRFVHPDQNRGISIREAAQIQGFPRRYKFPFVLQDAQKCIGNAIPPLLAKKVSLQILKSI